MPLPSAAPVPTLSAPGPASASSPPDAPAPAPFALGPSSALRQIPVASIHPGHWQARRRFDDTALAELAESLARTGVAQPLVVRPHALYPGDYELLAGERRWRAARLAGLERVPAIVRTDLTDAAAQVLGLVENLQRESLSALETARGLKRLADTERLTHQTVAGRIGKSRVYVTHFLRLLNLVPAVAEAVDDGRLTVGHGKALAALSPNQQRRWATRVERQGLTVRALERALEREGADDGAQPALPLDMPSAQAARAARADAQDAWRRLAGRVADQLALPAAFAATTPAGGGELRLKFHSWDELDGLLERLGLAPE